jgi:hypothetical protein
VLLHTIFNWGEAVLTASYRLRKPARRRAILFREKPHSALRALPIAASRDMDTFVAGKRGF